MEKRGSSKRPTKSPMVERPGSTSEDEDPDQKGKGKEKAKGKEKQKEKKREDSSSEEDDLEPNMAGSSSSSTSSSSRSSVMLQDLRRGGKDLEGLASSSSSELDDPFEVMKREEEKEIPLQGEAKAALSPPSPNALSSSAILKLMQVKDRVDEGPPAQMKTKVQNGSAEKPKSSGSGEQPSTSHKTVKRPPVEELEDRIALLREVCPDLPDATLLKSLEENEFHVPDALNALFDDGKTSSANVKGGKSKEEAEAEELQKELIRIREDLRKLKETKFDRKMLESSRSQLQQKHRSEDDAFRQTHTVIERPKQWTTKDSESVYKYIIDLNSDEARPIVERFYSGGVEDRREMEITKIERIQNKSLWDQYVTSQSAISSRNGKKINERMLFHGCSAKIINVIIEDGFDIRVSNVNGAAGAGIYFGEVMRTSLSYIKDCHADKLQLLFCRVELGSQVSLEETLKYYKSQKGGIRRPPPRSSSDPTPHDSVFGHIKNDLNHPMQVVFDNRQIYPEYLITFSLSPTSKAWGRLQRINAAQNWQHSSYTRQLKAYTEKYMVVVSVSCGIRPNHSSPDFPFLDRVRRLLTEDPKDPKSIHATEQLTLVALTSTMQTLAKLLAERAVILLRPPEGPTKTLEKGKAKEKETRNDKKEEGGQKEKNSSPRVEKNASDAEEKDETFADKVSHLLASIFHSSNGTASTSHPPSSSPRTPKSSSPRKKSSSSVNIAVSKPIKGDKPKASLSLILHARAESAQQYSTEVLLPFNESLIFDAVLWNNSKQPLRFLRCFRKDFSTLISGSFTFRVLLVFKMISTDKGKLGFKKVLASWPREDVPASPLPAPLPAATEGDIVTLAPETSSSSFFDPAIPIQVNFQSFSKKKSFHQVFFASPDGDHGQMPKTFVPRVFQVRLRYEFKGADDKFFIGEFASKSVTVYVVPRK